MPRIPDGHPDLQGIWSNATRTPVERPAEFAGKPTLTDAEATAWEKKEHQAWEELDGTSEGPLHKGKGSEGTGAYNVLFYDMGSGLMRVDGVKHTSMVIDPPDGKIPAVLPQARDRNRAAAARAASVDNVKDRGLSERCLFTPMAGPPMLPTLYNNNYQIVQTPDAVMILVEEIHDARVIRMNAKHAPPDVRQWLGDSIGHWEGDTLVIDTTGYNDKAWSPPAGYPHTEKLHVVERLRRIDLGRLEIEMTIDDPGTYKQTWTLKRASHLLPGEEIGEYVCAENNQDVQHMVGK
jgi:hypothetical protein